ncbi:hypothetical protein Emtol_1181 [Emticicia oligotrophica DSM 17448]|uniref:UbiA prenyltransferase family protein n=1 Tax=Emticicia oligotrophica (strain DSM 17448 / CIP 109782 / MTCC 6937 / GPTSA100-15) TaxID=929562 RepID=A0ABM5MYZ6_EMTOG|nr:hypothetical protein [Emticicia oligotrophica]AFK02330.1 hypothetical protein Emtol_1181 [Emticicia oligotrophica DSM 17448]
MLSNSKYSLLKTLHYLSLDVVVGAVVCSWMFWKMPDGKGVVNIPSLVILGICTWIIYILDRLLDNLKSEPEDARHKFHYEHQYYLQITIIILFLIATLMVFFLPKAVVYFGVTLVGVLFLYFYILQKNNISSDYQYFKEIFTAAIYCVCVSGGALSTKLELEADEFIAAFNFFLLVHQSILVFSFFELNDLPNTKNLAKKLGKKNCTYLIFGVFVFTMTSLFFAEIGFMEKVFQVEILMAFCTTLIFVFRNKIAVNDNYRWLGEMVFWLPLLLLIWT